MPLFGVFATILSKFFFVLEIVSQCKSLDYSLMLMGSKFSGHHHLTLHTKPLHHFRGQHKPNTNALLHNSYKKLRQNQNIYDLSHRNLIIKHLDLVMYLISRSEERRVGK